MSTPRLAFAAIAVVGALFAGVWLVNGNAHASRPEPIRAFWMNRPCATEDSVNCYWNDGSGHPLYSRKMPSGRICRFYVNVQYARHHDHCFYDHR